MYGATSLFADGFGKKRKRTYLSDMRRIPFVTSLHSLKTPVVHWKPDVESVLAKRQIKWVLCLWWMTEEVWTPSYTETSFQAFLGSFWIDTVHELLSTSKLLLKWTTGKSDLTMSPHDSTKPFVLEFLLCPTDVCSILFCYLWFSLERGKSSTPN